MSGPPQPLPPAARVTGSPTSGEGDRPPSFAAALSNLAGGDGALAVLELQALRRAEPQQCSAAEWHYWLGLAHLQAFDWGAAANELRAYLASDATTWRAGWAYLHLGRAYEQSGHDDEASLAYRGCLAVAGAERPARKLAFDLMTRLAGELPMGYGQATQRDAEQPPRRRWRWSGFRGREG